MGDRTRTLAPGEHHAQARPTGPLRVGGEFRERFRAVCTCGWQAAETRETRGQAEEEAAAHVIAEDEGGVTGTPTGPTS